jgi:DNA-binding IclR family transcriptional regulator
MTDNAAHAPRGNRSPRPSGDGRELAILTTAERLPESRPTADVSVHRHTRGDHRRVVESAFDLLEHVAALEPVRLVDLAAGTGIPRPTVHRLLQQLVGVGAVLREGTSYRLGATLLGLGAQVTPQPRLRCVARRPMAELAAATGAAVSLSGAIGDDVVYLETVNARIPIGFVAKPGALVPPGTAQARAHSQTVSSAPVLDAGEVLAGVSCVAVPIPLGRGEVAAVSTLVAAPRPPAGLVAATRVTAAHIGALLRTAPAGQTTILGNSPASRRRGQATASSAY